MKFCEPAFCLDSFEMKIWSMAKAVLTSIVVV